MTKGFTLVELSIVLVIIGLLIGGILTAQSLIDSAKINAQVRQLEQFKISYRLFKDKFNCIPGDCLILGGDGDDLINFSGDDYGDVGSESAAFFNHLSITNMTKENFDGSNTLETGYPKLAIDDNRGMGASNILRAASGISSSQITDVEGQMVREPTLHMNIGNSERMDDSGYNNSIGIFKPVEAVAIDRKMDDGVAREGDFRSYRALTFPDGNCLDGTNGDYDLSVDAASCHAEFSLED